MPLTLKQALALKVGAQLTFNTERVYTVIDVEDRSSDVYLTLKREDGYLTHATRSDLDVAMIVNAAPAPPQHKAATPVKKPDKA